MAKMSSAFCPPAAGFATGAVATGASSSSKSLTGADTLSAGFATGAAESSSTAGAGAAEPAGACTPAGRKY